ncbi:hypothetical protein IFM89_003968 [Coptis chinensis]|uniref:MORF/ORRM1/DAG-like MORF domain-containing protein n=1 Tax=Coptis chinensis TaxID=261450 RepID=A0A835H341_9MAGN|nr:hypothetical protein IFM89_003968 [Coptis chinensis]
MLHRRALQPLTKASAYRFSTSTTNPNTKLLFSSVTQNKKAVSHRYFSYSSSLDYQKSILDAGLVARYLQWTPISPSSQPMKETVLDGRDMKHWLVICDSPDPDLSRDDIIDIYIKTLAQILGSEGKARKQIYSVSTKHYFAFGCTVSEQLSYRIREMPKVRWVFPDSYTDIKNKEYPGEPFIDGQVVPYDPKYHEQWLQNKKNHEEMLTGLPETLICKQGSETKVTPQPMSVDVQPPIQNPDFQNSDMLPPVQNSDIHYRDMGKLPTRELATEIKEEVVEESHLLSSDTTSITTPVTENPKIPKAQKRKRQASTGSSGCQTPKDKEYTSELDLSFWPLLEKAKATAKEVTERAGDLYSQVKKYQAEAEGLRAEKDKDKAFISVLKEEIDKLLIEIDGLATKFKDANDNYAQLASEKSDLEEANDKIVAHLEAVKKDRDEQIRRSISGMKSFFDQLEMAKTELWRNN